MKYSPISKNQLLYTPKYINLNDQIIYYYSETRSASYRLIIIFYLYLTILVNA